MFKGLQIPPPLNWIRPRNLIRNCKNPIILENLGTRFGLHPSRFLIASLVVCPYHCTFIGRAILSLSCMSRASTIFTSRIFSLTTRLYSTFDYWEVWERFVTCSWSIKINNRSCCLGLAGGNASLCCNLLTIYPSENDKHFPRMTSISREWQHN